jgi:hypothetical protein
MHSSNQLSKRTTTHRIMMGKGRGMYGVVTGNSVGTEMTKKPGRK